MTKTNKIIYWLATALLAIGMLQSGIFALLRTKQWVDLVTGLGYPVYFLTILGTWKILGVIAILIPLEKQYSTIFLKAVYQHNIFTLECIARAAPF